MTSDALWRALEICFVHALGCASYSSNFQGRFILKSVMALSVTFDAFSCVSGLLVEHALGCASILVSLKAIL